MNNTTTTTTHMPVAVELKDGNDGRQHAVITIGDVTIIVHESQVRPGGVSVYIDTEDDFDPDAVKVWLNDWLACDWSRDS